MLNTNSSALAEHNEHETVVAKPPFSVKPESLGSAEFRHDYGIKYAYLAGAMFKGIASIELVVAMGKAGLMGYFGTGGSDVEEIKSAIVRIQSELNRGQPYGMNLLSNLENPELEMKTVELFLQHGVRYAEASAYMQISPALVRFRLSGIKRSSRGTIEIRNHVLAKISRPEVAEAFLRPAPEKIVEKLVAEGHLSAEEAALGREIPVAQDICVEADSGGHTDRGNASVLIPAIRSLSKIIMSEQNYLQPIRVGAAGGIGTPEAAAAAFVLGSDFVLTGSINQCTVEAGTSNSVKDILQELNVQDTDYAPAGDMFEIGAKVQVVKRGLFFPARANKLYDLYLHHKSIDEIDSHTKQLIQEKYFKRSFDEVWMETKAYYLNKHPEKLAMIERSPKQKMALIFRWYFVHTSRLATNGSNEQKVDYQIHCGPALGAFNQWVKGTELESWCKRHVADIGELLMTETALILENRMAALDTQIIHRM